MSTPKETAGIPAPDSDEFDEGYYLATYPDVAAAVRGGQFTSGLAHYAAFGRQEGRRGAATERAIIQAAAARNLEAQVSGRTWSTLPVWKHHPGAETAANPSNDLEKFFESRREGRGIWKWRHYFDTYDRHFSRFRGLEVHVLEIGVYSGGSLDMWRDYFGPKARIYGVDIESACQAYESDGVRIFIGDQTDRAFWHRFRTEVPSLDIVIDDGGHLYDQQRITLEELLPHVRPGGVYVCEDIHGENNSFGAYLTGLASMLNAGEVTGRPEDVDRRLVCRASALQAAVKSIGFHPQMVVIEKNLLGIAEFVAPKRGTEWQPFLR